MSTAEIKLTKGKVALVDVQDLELVNICSWHFDSSGYAGGMLPGRKMVRMHRHVLGAKRGQVVDHINGNRLDNRRVNLRFVDRTQQSCNRKNRCTTRPYKGIWFSAKLQKWCGRLCYKGKVYTSRFFVEMEDAARAYDELAKVHHGEYARLNFPLKEGP